MRAFVMTELAAVNAKVMVEDSIVPAFCKTDGFTLPGYANKAAGALYGTPLCVQQAGDVVACLVIPKN